MATVGSSLSSACSVFGGNTLYGLRRGANVPNYAAYAGVSTTIPKLSELVGLVSPLVSFSGIDATTSTPTGGTATITIGSDGTYSGAASGGSGTWKLGGSASNFDVRYTKTSGTTPTGSAVNTWLNLASTQSWSLNQPSGAAGSKTCSGTIEIRDTTSGTVLGSGTSTITAEDYS